jgi:fluoride exporter
MRTVMAVGLAGFIGAIARYGIDGVIVQKSGGSFPWGTFLINISGSFVLGLLFAVLVEGRVAVAPWIRTASTVGLVGAYTTFSTLTLETFRLVEDGSYFLAGANAVGSLTLGLVAVYLGVVVGRMV